MDALHTVVQKLSALFDGIVGAVFLDLAGTVFHFFQVIHNVVGELCSAHFGEPFDLAEVGDGHNAGNDGNMDARLFSALQKIKEGVIVEKKLSYDKVRPGIHF